MSFTQSTTRQLPDLFGLRQRFSGEIHAPGDVAYDEARQGWNLTADLRPALVAVPRRVDDIVAIVDYAREHGLRVAPQGTGHNGTALGDLEDSILLKTHLMRGVELDFDARRVRAEAGALCMDVLGPASERGFAILGGSAADVGIVGYTLGGGAGWLGRSHGLCANSVLAIEAVLADGSQVRCDADTHPELFWALRGGTGSYAIVTAIELELFPMPELYGGAMLWPWERSAEVLKAWTAWTRTAPESVTTAATILQVPPVPDIPEPLRGRQFIRIDGAVIGSEAEAREILAPLIALEPEIDLFGVCPPAALSELHMDPDHPVPGLSDHALLEDLTDEVIDALVAVAGPGSDSPLLLVEIRHWGGALSRVPEGAGALGCIPTQYGMFNLGSPMDPAMAPAINQHLPKVRAAMAPVIAEQVYLNFADRQSDTATVFGAQTFAVLQGVKATYDPSDLIQSNHAVAPASE